MLFEETTKDVEGVEVLRGPIPVADDKGTVYATAQIQRVEQTDFKTKAPTGEKLVFLAASPLSGRKPQPIRLKLVVDSLRALGIETIAPPETVTVGKGDERAEVPPHVVPLLKQGWEVVKDQ